MLRKDAALKQIPKQRSGKKERDWEETKKMRERNKISTSYENSLRKRREDSTCIKKKRDAIKKKERSW